ncbi:hypothetical protein SISNIDRAFT_463585 [Sistotremastrum niveocremeum HHB9708]|uniref:Uncharacterized protein n=1 Tax=Sistotremastrum niveocremeum HHB9708 TaxID=1314777 RepID=A0A164YEB5_9AGAM|nr:hypothetical protein SISNIDRAFT_463585 [Sistotremastrum niveocremeum HHB9708]
MLITQQGNTSSLPESSEDSIGRASAFERFMIWKETLKILEACDRTSSGSQCRHPQQHPAQWQFHRSARVWDMIGLVLVDTEMTQRSMFEPHQSIRSTFSIQRCGLVHAQQYTGQIPKGRACFILSGNHPACCIDFEESCRTSSRFAGLALLLRGPWSLTFVILSTISISHIILILSRMFAALPLAVERGTVSQAGSAFNGRHAESVMCMTNFRSECFNLSSTLLGLGKCQGLVDLVIGQATVGFTTPSVGSIWAFFSVSRFKLTGLAIGLVFAGVIFVQSTLEGSSMQQALPRRHH